ncbi:glycosyltransferase family A protein [Vibrio vulnificus]
MINYSICIPIYNGELYVIDTLKSIEIAISGRKDIELILFNDGSTDGSLTLVSEYLKKKVINYKIINSSNVGRSKARNIAASEAKGNYFIFIDADDLIEENYFSLLDRKLISDSFDLVVSEVVFINKFGERLGEQMSYEASKSIHENIIIGNMPYTSAICVKNNIFAHVKGFCSDLQEREDWHFAAKVATVDKVKIAMLTEKPIKIRYHDSNNSGNSNRFLTHTINVSQMICEMTHREKKLRYKVMAANIKHFSSRNISISMKMKGLKYVFSSNIYICLSSAKETLHMVKHILKIILVNYE